MPCNVSTLYFCMMAYMQMEKGCSSTFTSLACSYIKMWVLMLIVQTNKDSSIKPFLNSATSCEKVNRFPVNVTMLPRDNYFNLHFLNVGGSNFVFLGSMKWIYCRVSAAYLCYLWRRKCQFGYSEILLLRGKLHLRAQGCFLPLLSSFSFLIQYIASPWIPYLLPPIAQFFSLSLFSAFSIL